LSVSLCVFHYALQPASFFILFVIFFVFETILICFFNDLRFGRGSSRRISRTANGCRRGVYKQYFRFRWYCKFVIAIAIYAYAYGVFVFVFCGCRPFFSSSLSFSFSLVCIDDIDVIILQLLFFHTTKETTPTLNPLLRIIRTGCGCGAVIYNAEHWHYQFILELSSIALTCLSTIFILIFLGSPGFFRRVL
jgi:hypothetical protein